MGRKALLRVMVVVATVGSAVTLTAGPANAATGVFLSGSNVIVNAGAGVANNITINVSGNSIIIQDTRAVLTAGTGCALQTNGSVACGISPNDATVVVNAGDLGDTITKIGNVRGDLRGQTGNDTINGGPSPGSNILNGGADRDTLNGGPTFDLLIGGAGPDRLSGGGGTNDIASYFESGAGVVVDIDNTADDGIGGEGDDVRTDVEIVYGSEFNDTITGSASNDSMLGFGGSDRLVGGAGNDNLTGDLVPSNSGLVGSDTLIGGPGNDTLNGVDNIRGNDSLDGGDQTDTCTADTSDTKRFCEA